MASTDAAGNTVHDAIADAPAAMLALQVHVAEYGAITMRNTYWITLQFALWPTAIISLALVGQMWPEHWDPGLQEVLLWTGLAGLQVIGLLWYLAAGEQYRNIAYLENVLRPRVVGVLSGALGVWLYEQSLARSRGRGPWLSEWSIAIVSFTSTAGVAIACAAMAWDPWNWFGVAVCSALGGAHALQSRYLTRFRQDMTRSWPAVATEPPNKESCS